MTKTFTYDDVVRYIYSETSSEESESIARALTCDDDLMSFYLDTLEIRNQMNLIVRQPSQRVVSKILAYSEAIPNRMRPVTSA
jgi:hypothetical protein